MASEADIQANEPEQGDGSDDNPSKLRNLLSEADAKRRELEATVANLQGQIAVLSKPKEPAPSQKPAVLSEAQLSQMVEDGKCTQAEADQYRRNAIRQEVEASVTEKVLSEVNNNAKMQKAIDTYAQYAAARPDIDREGTEDRNKCIAAMQELVAGGLPNNKETEVLACRMVFGPVSQIAKKPTRQAGTAEDAISGGGSPDVSDSGDGLPSSIPPHKRAYYKKQIDSGRKTAKEVAEMWKKYGNAA